MFALSAVAVEREIVGKDSNAELIGGDAELLNDCCWAALAARRAAVADCASGFDLGEVENNWTSRFVFDAGVFCRMPPFSSDGEKDGRVMGELLVKGFVGRRGIAGFSANNDAGRSGCSQKGSICWNSARSLAERSSKPWIRRVRCCSYYCCSQRVRGRLGVGGWRSRSCGVDSNSVHGSKILSFHFPQPSDFWKDCHCGEREGNIKY
jgi:hypothetical protein